MTEPSEPRQQGEPTPIGGELIIPVLAVVFTLYYFSTIVDSPWSAQVSAFFIGSILIALCAVFLVLAAGRVRRGSATLGLDLLSAPRRMIPKRVALFVLTLGYVLCIDWGGFTLTTFVFLLLAMLLLGGGRNRGLAFGLAAAMAFGGYLLFIVAFGTRFPVGPFERLMKAMF